MQDRRNANPPEGSINLCAWLSMWGEADEPKSATLTPAPRPKDPARVAVGV